MTERKKVIIPVEYIQNKIYFIRNKQVMVDRDLAELYGVETKRLKEQVRRNIKRFPSDFMFELTKEEFNTWRSQIATSKSDKKGLRYKPFVFTEQGVAMLSTILNSERAIEVNIQIMRTFVKIKKMLLDTTKIKEQLKLLVEKTGKHDEQIKNIFTAIQYLISENENRKKVVSKNKKKIGFKSK